MFQPKLGMSNVWKGITDNARFLCEGMRVAVGDGNRTLFWSHKWVTNTPLSNLAIQPVPRELEGATVNEMWDSITGWKWESFAPFLHQDTLKLIQAIELKEDAELGDLIYWQSGNKGKFSIKSALSIMRNVTDSLDQTCWDLIWTAPVQQRIRAFLWVACHDRVMSNALRFNRKLTEDARCYVCGAEVESTLHILRNCPLAQVVWRNLGGPADKPEFYQQHLKHWITANLKHEDDKG